MTLCTCIRGITNIRLSTMSFKLRDQSKVPYIPRSLPLRARWFTRRRASISRSPGAWGVGRWLGDSTIWSLFNNRPAWRRLPLHSVVAAPCCRGARVCWLAQNSIEL